MQKKTDYLLPFLFAVFLAVGMFLGTKFNPNESGGTKDQYDKKLDQVLGYIDNIYVDTPDKELLVELAIEEMLAELDPYSAYISAKDLAHANEQLEGNFEGIGVEFNVINDTVSVLHVIQGGPSEKLGILPGDQIVTVEGESIAGVNIKNTEIIRKLKGPKGTSVSVGIKRKYESELLPFDIVRDEIKIESVIAVYMANENTGYIKVTRFAGNTGDDFSKAIDDLKDKGAENLIVDLRGNPGGYLGTAIQMVDEFVEKGELITYTQGRARKRDEHLATGNGSYKQGKLCVLIDEGSASASEIFSGAIQDLDRGLVVGQRSHGKGLVQEPIELKDGSQIRLTVARYYTPSGRCIQRPYDMNIENGAGDAKAEKFTTKNGREVLDGGGIVPDIEVKGDSTLTTSYYATVIRKGLLYELALNYQRSNREQMLKEYSNYNIFNERFRMPQSITDSLTVQTKDVIGNFSNDQLLKSRVLIEAQFKAMLARYTWGDEAYEFIINQQDDTYQKGLEALKENSFAQYGID